MRINRIKQIIPDDMNIVCLAKGSQRFIFIYDDANSYEVLESIARFAANSELDFDWRDANRLAEVVDRKRQEMLE